MTRRLGLSPTGQKASLMTLMLLVSVSTGVFVYSYPHTTLSQDEDPSDPFIMGDSTFELAEELLSLFGASHAQVKAALDRLVDEGLVIPEAAEDVLRSGEEAAAVAYYYMLTGDYGSAIEKATEALQLFGESLQIALEAPQEPTKVEDVADASSVKLRVRIERGYSRQSELYETLHQLEENLLHVSDLQVLQFMMTNFLLEKADECHESASALLEEGDLEAVESELAMAEVYLDEALKLLQTISESAKSEKASKFAETSEKRLHKLEDVVTNMVGEEAYAELDTTVAQETLQNAKNVNKAVKTMIESGELESATGDLEKVKGLADDVVEMIEEVDEDLGESLKKVERLEARKSNLEEKIERLGSKGRDTTKFEEQLKGVNEELDSEIEDWGFSMSTGTEEPPAKSEDPPTKSEDPPAKSEDPPETSEDPPAKSEDPPETSEDPPAKSKDPPATYEDPLKFEAVL
jgi:tetratricopeptide (TPR) repeat protein